MTVRFLLSPRALMVTRLAETWENFPCGVAPPHPLETGRAPVQVQSRRWICIALRDRQPPAPALGWASRKARFSLQGEGGKGVATDTDV